MPRDDKILSPSEAKFVLSGVVVVEEKLDGANLGVSLTSEGHLQLQNRGEYLHPPYIGQFARLDEWLARHTKNLLDVLTPELILFGEWCAARHSLDYPTLPDWFLLFDVYDRSTLRFWSTLRRKMLAQKAALHCVPHVATGHFTVTELTQLINKTPSSCREGLMEGIVIRRDSEHWNEQRAKLVRAEFVQSIEEHWSRRPLEWNRVDWIKNQKNYMEI